jgi:hypothetical protein
MHSSENRTTGLKPRHLRTWCFDVLKQVLLGAIIYFVVASFVNKDKVIQPDATATLAPSSQASESRPPDGNEKPTATIMKAASLQHIQ